MKIERFTNGISSKGTTCYEADNLIEAMRKAAEMVERYPSAAEPSLPNRDHETRITVGPVLET